MRDLDNGRPFKDLDIMVHAATDFETILQRLKGLGAWLPITGKNDGRYADGWQSEVLGYVDMCGFGQAVQIIPVKCPPSASLDRLDFGICQISFDGCEVRRTPAYDRDKANHTFTLVRSDTPAERERSIRRYERLQTKYPGWAFVDRRLPFFT